MRKAINMILTALSAAILMVWVWKFFGPGSEETRSAGNAALGSIGSSLGGMLWISISVACLGYLLWRFMGWLFWHKYFHEDPPDEDE